MVSHPSRTDGGAAKVGILKHCTLGIAVLLLIRRYVTAPIAGFVAFEFGGGFAGFRGFISPFGHVSAIAVLGVVGVVNLALEVGGAMKPGTYAEEGAAGEPLRSIIAVGNAVIGCVVVVAVRAIGSDGDVGCDLGLGFWGGYHTGDCDD